MVSFELSKEIEKDVFHFVSSVGQRESSRVSMRNRISDLRIPRSDTLPLSHKDSTVSEGYYEVHMTRFLLTVRKLLSEFLIIRELS